MIQITITNTTRKAFILSCAVAAHLHETPLEFKGNELWKVIKKRGALTAREIRELAAICPKCKESIQRQNHNPFGKDFSILRKKDVLFALDLLSG